MAQTRPSRKVQPTAKLGADNAGDVELRSHKKAIANARQQGKIPLSMSISTLVPGLPSQSTGTTMAATASTIVPDNDSGDQHKDIPIAKSAKRRIVDSDSDPEENNNDGVSDTSPSTESTPQCRKPKKKKKKAKKSIQGMFTPYCITLAYRPQETTMWTRWVCIETSLFKTLTMPSPIRACPKC